jgi:predicted ester cyclase
VFSPGLVDWRHLRAAKMQPVAWQSEKIAQVWSVIDKAAIEAQL